MHNTATATRWCIGNQFFVPTLPLSCPSFIHFTTCQLEWMDKNCDFNMPVSIEWRPVRLPIPSNAIYFHSRIAFISFATRNLVRGRSLYVLRVTIVCGDEIYGKRFTKNLSNYFTSNFFVFARFQTLISTIRSDSQMIVGTLTFS